MISNTIIWNPIEGIDLGFFMIRFYSLMFVVAFSLGFYLMKKIYIRENISMEKLDSVFIYAVLGTLIGARLGHVLFYDWNYYKNNLLEIFLPMRFRPEFEFIGFQGLASHGAAVAFIIAMYYYSKKVLNNKNPLWILDRVTIPAAFGGIFVRLGNFFNSEIIGKASEDFPLGVKFVREGIKKSQAIKETGIRNINEAYSAIVNDPKHADLLASVEYRHPAQLYESFGYIFVSFILLYFYWKTEKRNHLGFLFGMYLILIFTVRFFVEYVKSSQGGFENALGVLSTGQWLSIPFVLVGLYFVLRPRKSTLKN